MIRPGPEVDNIITQYATIAATLQLEQYWQGSWWWVTLVWHCNIDRMCQVIGPLHQPLASVICISSSLSNSSVVSRLINITSYTCNGRHFLMVYRKMVLNCANVPVVYFFRNEILQLECVRTEQFLSNAWLIKSATNGFYISIISYNYQPLPTKQHLFCQAAGQAEAQVSSWYKTLLLSSKVIQLKWYCPKLKVNCHNSISKIRNVRNVEQHLHFKYKQSNLLLLCSKVGMQCV